ncbi:hypothetical protein WR25_13762 [Diploscapter pachys]|uniref:Chloride channel protein n=1 Tax=Diploscapter pachys TaxID=2018661 RepID=A0A2A2J9B6_9BILA|nr:hypothetical protein WR25_13762 [Diploscapter pachys]
MALYEYAKQHTDYMAFGTWLGYVTILTGLASFICFAFGRQAVAGTITAYYQTNFPNEVFVVEEIPIFMAMGVTFGLLGALFIWFHRQVALFKKKNKAFVAIFGTRVTFGLLGAVFIWFHRQVSLFKKKNKTYVGIFGKRPVVFTILMAVFIAMMTFPDGLGKFFAGYLTFHETLSDFIANCTFMTNSSMRCSEHVINHWTMGFSNPLYAFLLYSLFYFIMVPICLTLFIPNGIFVPCFVMGASAGRLIGEVLAQTWPEGMRGLDGPQIFPGLYAVVGAAAYTGSITHSLSIAVIVCETTGQLCALLPVLIALMIANAICSFLQPSIYESTIKIQNYPYLADLPPSRAGEVHTLFSLLALNHAYVTDRGRLVGVVALKELRSSLEGIYFRGVLLPQHRSLSVSMRLYSGDEEEGTQIPLESNGNGPRVRIEVPSNNSIRDRNNDANTNEKSD